MAGNRMHRSVATRCSAPSARPRTPAPSPRRASGDALRIAVTERRECVLCASPWLPLDAVRWPPSANLALRAAIEDASVLPLTGSAAIDAALPDACFALLRPASTIGGDCTPTSPCSHTATIGTDTQVHLYTRGSDVERGIERAIERVCRVALVDAATLLAVLRRCGARRACIDPHGAFAFTLTEGHLQRLAHAVARRRPPA